MTIDPLKKPRMLIRIKDISYIKNLKVQKTPPQTDSLSLSLSRI